MAPNAAASLVTLPAILDTVAQYTAWSDSDTDEMEKTDEVAPEIFVPFLYHS